MMITVLRLWTDTADPCWTELWNCHCELSRKSPENTLYQRVPSRRIENFHQKSLFKAQQLPAIDFKARLKWTMGETKTIMCYYFPKFSFVHYRNWNTMWMHEDYFKCSLIVTRVKIRVRTVGCWGGTSTDGRQFRRLLRDATVRMFMCYQHCWNSESNSRILMSQSQQKNIGN